jgi:23S rRNA pseudouridine1911/1915/1917 synthase
VKAAKLSILHRDDKLVAVAKPAGLASIGGRGESTSVLEQLGEMLGVPSTGKIDPRVRVVHRLDKDTSGVMAFALDVDTQRHLSHQFQNNTASKQYLAVVSNSPSDDSGTIDAPLDVHPTDKTRMAVNRRGRRAITEWKVEQRFGPVALLRVFPKTGKTHQIRVHLAHAGHPLLIDPLYNPEGPTGLFLSHFKRGYRPGRDEERPLIARLTLHAETLSIDHPTAGPVTLAAPLPKDFSIAINALSKHVRR